ncbi:MULTISPECIES: arsenate reductase (azurin) small subunit [Thiomonas]|uniref:Arsenite oxidase subunit AioB n=1 Tax=Thiomonas delicata TaxID=364030 RepID=A0A238D022_THIDL|nr:MULTISPECIES: arsenate reductase (azurin) small subunit [Thiomonas]SBP86590.1 Arsenite oxidase subunit AioB [Thiomonas delicata]
MTEKVSRRIFLKVAGTSVAGVGAAVSPVGSAVAAGNNQAAIQTAAGAAVLPYPKISVGKAQSMQANTPVSFSYPDGDSPCVAIKMGQRVAGGVGPDGDIVAYSNLCTHMGCPLMYDPATQRFKCPCHYSMFDPEKSGQMICGQATEDLPQIQLEYDPASDSVRAVAVTGLIYGRQANVL